MDFFKGRLNVHKAPVVFIFKLLLIYFSWKVISLILGEQHKTFDDRLWPFLSFQWEQINQFVRAIDIRSSTFLLNVIGFETINWHDYYFAIKNHVSLRVGNYCLGFQLWYYFIGLIFISRISLSIRLISIILSFAFIQILNIARLIALALVSVYFPDYVHIGHDYVFNILVLAVLFWVYVKLNQRHSMSYKVGDL